MRPRAVAGMRRRVLTGTVMAVLGVLVLTAGIAWPREPLGRPAGAAAPFGAPSASSDPWDAPAPVAPPSSLPGPSAAPSTVDAPSVAPDPPPPVPGWTLVDYDNFDGATLDH